MEILEGLSFDEYLEIDAINASLLKEYSVSPKRGIWSQSRIKESSAMEIGKLAHTLCLEGEGAFLQQMEREYCVSGAINPRTGAPYGKDTKAFKEWVKEFSFGRKVVTEQEIEDVKEISRQVYNHRPSRNTLELCDKRELTLIWDYQGLKCKARLDLFGDRIICDLKTTSKLKSKYQIIIECKKYDYDLQFAWYYDGAIACGLNPLEFRAIFAQSVEEKDVGCFKISNKMLDAGRIKYREALKNYEDAQKGVLRGKFPSLEEITFYDED